MVILFRQKRIPKSRRIDRCGSGAALLLAAGLCGLGQGKATASATEALARNPGARPGIFIFLILGLAFIESLALFTFVIIFLKVTPL